MNRKELYTQTHTKLGMFWYTWQTNWKLKIENWPIGLGGACKPSGSIDEYQYYK